jgi:hypothetical protein
MLENSPFGQGPVQKLRASSRVSHQLSYRPIQESILEWGNGYQPLGQVPGLQTGANRPRCGLPKDCGLC